jgi:hypothetical protein
MNTYRLNIRPSARLAITGWMTPTLTPDAIAAHLGDVTVRELSSTDSYNWVLDLELAEPSHDEALNAIFIAVQQLGFEVLDAYVTEWADRAAELALLGLAGGGIAGSSSRDPDITALIAIASGVAGAWFGSKLKRAETVYEVRRAYPSGWVLTPVPKQQTPAPVVRPGYLQA